MRFIGPDKCVVDCEAATSARRAMTPRRDFIDLIGRWTNICHDILRRRPQWLLKPNIESGSPQAQPDSVMSQQLSLHKKNITSRNHNTHSWQTLLFFASVSPTTGHRFQVRCPMTALALSMAGFTLGPSVGREIGRFWAYFPKKSLF